MNPIIQKCVEELNKETPRLDYIRGMLESVLLSSAPFPRAMAGAISPPLLEDIAKTTDTALLELSDEQKSIVDTYEKGPIGKIT